MSEWKTVRLGDFVDTISETYHGGHDTVVLINTSDVLAGKIINHEQVPNKRLAGQFKKTFKCGDILFSEIRPANQRYALVEQEDCERYIASTKLMVLRRKNESIDLPAVSSDG